MSDSEENHIPPKPMPKVAVFNFQPPKYKSSYHPDSTTSSLFDDTEFEAKLKRRMKLAGGADDATESSSTEPTKKKESAEEPIISHSVAPLRPNKPALPPPLPNMNRSKFNLQESPSQNTSTHPAPRPTSPVSSLSKEAGDDDTVENIPTVDSSNTPASTSTGESSPANGLNENEGLNKNSNQLPEDKLDRLRFKTVQELMDSERDYIRDIDVIMKNIHNPLLERDILSKDDMRNIFSNLSQLQGINQQLLRNFENALKESNNDYNRVRVGLILKEMVEFFKSYMTYVANQDLSMAIIERSRKKNPKFDKFVKELSENTELRGLDMISFMIKPIQRICKYPLFLRELLKHTKPENPDLPDLELAAKGLERVASLVNESKLKNENQAKIREIASSLSGISADKIIQPSRWFVREATFIKLSKGREQERHFFLFNDVIIWAKATDKAKYTYRGEISMDLVLCQDVIKPENNRFAFELCRLDKKKKKYVIYTKDKDEKETWIQLLLKCHYDLQEKQHKRPNSTISVGGSIIEPNSNLNTTPHVGTTSLGLDGKVAPNSARIMTPSIQAPSEDPLAISGGSGGGLHSSFSLDQEEPKDRFSTSRRERSLSSKKKDDKKKK
eukprot:TRINITY_DN15255_c0_g1_i1.p1 TRINITY_DN15255_c0_g1~~TRINITY_DN15255_c0_g1_i1.p1  ORF type:complete len:616 (-),score=147.50 TRINITY_DN15255_c0_g1_i1:134-1981(-)